jgi:hypothetical protein
VAPALLAHHFLTRGAPIPDDVLTGIIDEIVLPLVQAGHPTPGADPPPQRLRSIVERKTAEIER